MRDANLRHGIVDAAGRAARDAPFAHAFDDCVAPATQDNGASTGRLAVAL
ncbi:hypothetical protein [Burkholderia sp. PU8-34]